MLEQIDITLEPELYSISSDKMCVNYSSKRSLKSRMASDWSSDQKQDKQTWWPEVIENASTTNGTTATTVTSSDQKSRRKSSRKVAFGDCSLLRTRSTSLDSSSTENSLSSTSDSVIFSWEPAPMSKILPRLYVGSYDNAMDELELKAKGITHILSLFGKSWSVDFAQQETIPMHDLGRTDLKVVLAKAAKFMEQGQEDGCRILVHCQSGQNRSATVVIAYQMIYQKETLYRAHKRVKSLRPLVQVNVGYAKQLLALEKEIFGKNSLPCDWMERGEVDITTGEVNYKHENVNSVQHRVIFD